MLRHTYESDVLIAHYALQEKDLRRVEEVLSRYLPAPGQGANPVRTLAQDLRGFEWRLLWSLSQGMEEEVVLHPPNQAFAEAWSSEENLVATAGADQTVTVWETGSWQPVVHLEDPQPDPAFTGENSVVFSPDGRWLVRAGGHALVAWETSNWGAPVRIEESARPHYDFVRRPVRFSHDGKRLAAATNRGVEFWETDSWKKREEEIEFLVQDLAFSDDGSFFAVAGNTLQVWDGHAERLLEEIPFAGPRLTFAPGDGVLAAGGRDGWVLLWDTERQEESGLWQAHRGIVRALAFSRDGRFLATSGDDLMIRLWHWQGQELRAPPELAAELAGHRHRVVSLAFSPDSSRLLSGSHDRTARVWNIDAVANASGDRVLPGMGLPLWFSPDGAELATVDTEWAVRYWDLAAQRELRRVPPLTSPERMESIALAPDGKTCAAGLANGAIELWDLQTRRKLAAEHENEPAKGFRFSPDQRRLVSFHGDLEDLRIWALSNSSLRLEAKLPSPGTRALAFSPDGRVLAHGFSKLGLRQGADRFARLWEVATRRELPSPSISDPYLVYALAFSPDGRHLAGGWATHNAIIFDLDDGTHRTLMGHVASVGSVAYSPDGRTVATGSGDGTVKLWSALTGRELVSLQYGKPVGVVMFSPDGRTLTAGSRLTEFRLWRAPALDEIDGIAAR